jgi:hypothetical protein
VFDLCARHRRTSRHARQHPANNLPAGLSLAPTTKAQHLTEETPAIEGEKSYTANWIIRGDTPGEYPNLSATYSSTLEPFLAPVNASAALAQPLKVWGKEARLQNNHSKRRDKPAWRSE